MVHSGELREDAGDLQPHDPERGRARDEKRDAPQVLLAAVVFPTDRRRIAGAVVAPRELS